MQGSAPFIRVDTFTDIVFLDDHTSILEGTKWCQRFIPKLDSHIADMHLENGRTLYKKSLFLAAARVWSLGIRHHSLSTALRLNRSQAYLRLGWYRAALVDALYVLNGLAPPSAEISQKANYRAACAEYGLGQYSEALRRFQSIVHEDAANWISRCSSRIEEVSKGRYDWVKMFKDGQAEVPCLDVADFVGPVRVQSIAGRGGGRGMIATRNIKTGELLVRSDPTAVLIMKPETLLPS
jgi:hypothetical protein